MANIEKIPKELQELVKPHLRECLEEDSWSYIDSILSEGVYTYPDGVAYVTFNIPGYAALQFSVETGEFMELTDWDYIQTVDAEAQLEAATEKDRINRLTTILEHYLRNEYRHITDFERVIRERQKINVNGSVVYVYSCPCQNIYLDEDDCPISYDRQKVTDDTYLYNFGEETETNINGDEDDLYTYSVRLNWNREDLFD